MGVTESIYLASDSAEESFGRSSEPLLFQLPAPPARTLQIKLLPFVRCALPWHPSLLLLNPMSSVLLLAPKLAFFWSFLLFTCFPSLWLLSPFFHVRCLESSVHLRLLSLKPTKNSVMTV